jgi:atypical dual specificity phosphatase
MTEAAVISSLNFSWLEDGVIAGCAAPMLPEDLAFLRAHGVRAMLRLAYPGKDDFVIADSHVRAAGLEDCHIPVRDFTAPTLSQIKEALRFIDQQLERGNAVAVCCGAGCGRTGTILAAYLVRNGLSAEEALRTVVSKRPCSDEIFTRTPAQMAAVQAFERHLRYRERSHRERRG